ncbi:MAG: hypothetical protein IKL73_05330 [Lachnospiraceae bacterium]|nr:hypothetical protein [Lachnospiraceae bacterium]
MRTMLLSLKPDIYNQIATGKKIFEHRKVFPDEPIKAYIYISRPVQAIAGVMILENKTPLEYWKNLFSFDKEAILRITDFMSRNKYAIQIKQFQDTNRIPLALIKEIEPTFVIPQMYYFIDESNLLSYLEQNLFPQGDLISNDFLEITSDMVCRY